MTDTATAGKSQRAYEHARERITRGRATPPGTGWCSTRSPRAWASASCRCARRSAGSRPRGWSPSSATSAPVSPCIDRPSTAYTMQTLGIVEGAATALSAPHADRRASTGARARSTTGCASASPALRPAPVHPAEPASSTASCSSRAPTRTSSTSCTAGWSRLAILRDSTFSFVPGRAHDSVGEHEALLASSSTGADPLEIELAARPTAAHPRRLPRHAHDHCIRPEHP